MFLPFFVGSQVIMALYNIIVFFHVKDRSYLYYAIHLISNAGYAIFCWVRVDESLQEDYPITSDYFYLLVLCTTVGMIAYMHFLRNFLSLKRNLPRWNKIFKFYGNLGWFILVLVLGLFIFYPEPVRPSLVVATLYVLLSTIIGLAFLPALFKLRKKTNFYFIFGFFVLTIFAAISVISRILGMEYFFVCIEIGVLSEAILYSIGLTYQTQQKEKISRQTLVELEMSKSRRQITQMEADRQAEISALRKDFYTNLTHEFRTPLTVISGMAEEITQRVESSEVSTMGEMISRNSKTLLNIVNQMLEIEKQNHHQSDIQYVFNDIVSYLKYILACFQSLAQSKNIDLKFQSEIKQMEIFYDEFRIQQIMYNLISNAIKYSKSGNEVQVTVRQENEQFYNIEVVDTGPGIKESEHDKIFEKYYQVSKGAEENVASSGIGLYFTKNLVDVLGGEISLESHIGKGSTFTVSLPILRQDPVKTKAPEAEDQQILPSTAFEHSPDQNKPLLLIAEDNYDVASYLAYCLKENYELMISYDGAEAIQMAIDHLPDIIISDVMMPKKNGYELCVAIKTNSTTMHIPIILLSGKSDYEAKMQGIEKGADAYLAKPFKKDELLLRLRKLFELRANLQAKYASGKLLVEEREENATLEDPFLTAIRSLILENIGNADLQITHLTSQLFVSHTQLSRKIKALTNMTPIRYIRQVRLSKAKELLQKKDLSIAEIAYSTGFSDPNYFSRVFKKEFDKAPGEYRETLN